MESSMTVEDQPQEENSNEIIPEATTINNNTTTTNPSQSSSSLFAAKPWHSEFEHRPMRTMVQNTIFQLIFEVYIFMLYYFF